MLPSNSDYRSGVTQWRSTHRGVSYRVSHHGVSEYSPQGIWCFYVVFEKIMFVRDEDWALFDLPWEVREWNGRYIRHYPYERIPEFSWHGEATWGKRLTLFDRDTGTEYPAVEVGCDYAHLFDRECGYPYSLASVRQDAIAVVEELLARYPQKERCAYCGKIDLPEMFYDTAGGLRVHKSMEDKIRQSGWTTWLPRDDAPTKVGTS